MSLISQNAISKPRREEVDGEAANGSPLTHTDEEMELGDKPNSSGLKKKNKKRTREHGTVEAEQEKELKDLENNLSGTLYSPPWSSARKLADYVARLCAQHAKLNMGT